MDLDLWAKKLTQSRSLFSFFEVVIGSRIIEVSSAMSSTLDPRLPHKSLIYIKKQWTKN